MPEGPEIRRAADRIARVLLNQPVIAAEFGLPRLQRFSKRLTGATVTAVNTRGKAMLTRFDNGLTLYSHNQLYGRWYIVHRPTMPKTGRSLRAALHTPTHSALLYSASDIEVLTERQLAKHAFLNRLGPDILDPEVTVDTIADRLQSEQFRRRALGSLYLDQSFLAGNGNYLRSEILWSARLDPAMKPADIEAAELRELGKQTLKISRRSYRTRGVTIAPSLARALKGSGQSYEKYRFYVFGREGRPCHHCGSLIERRSMASRNLFLCPICQPSASGKAGISA